MLTTYRRHVKTCAHRSDGRKYRRCRCPVWADGFLGREEIRKSLDTRDWENAQGIIRQWEAEGERTPEPDRDEPTTIAEAWSRFIADSKARGLREPTIRKYEHLKRQMDSFGQDHGLRYVAEFNVDNLTAFRGTWPNHNLSALKKLELLRTFFRFCGDRNWVSDNPAKKIRNPKIRDRPTLPFTRDEQVEILKALEPLRHSPIRNQRRLRALILMLRYSGLRISDAVTLSRDRINAGRLFLYTSKAGTPVYCPLPDIVTEGLESVASASEQWFFWTGQSKPKTVISHWTLELKEFLANVKINGGHAHRFRDTFAVEPLLANVPMERVSALLGHRSIRVTEKHYAPWGRARQEQLEADVRRSWATWIPETNGTPEVHGERRSVN